MRITDPRGSARGEDPPRDSITAGKCLYRQAFAEQSEFFREKLFSRKKRRMQHVCKVLFDFAYMLYGSCTFGGKVVK